MTQTQRYVYIALCLAALGLRLEGIGANSLSHYDEGVYVYNGLQAAFGNPLAFNFDQALHSPPLFPWMIAAVCRILQTPWPAAGILVSSFAGVATLPVVFAIVRRIAGSRTALLAMAMLAFSDLHIAYSRMALTDVSLTFWLSTAVYAAIRLEDSLRMQDRALAARPWLVALVLAATTALAWNTKYNGWMPLAIALVAAIWLPIRTIFGISPLDKRCGVVWRKHCLWLLVAGLIAGVCYLPWYWFVEQNFPGGYRAVTDHHRTYIGGISQWPSNCWQLLLSMAAYRHYGWVIGCCGSILAGVGFVASRRSLGRGAQAASLAATVGLLIAACVLGTDATIMIVATLGILPLFWFGSHAEVVLAVWAGAFFVLVPAYHPFTRLLVPLNVAAVCLFAVIAVRAVETVETERAPHLSMRWMRHIVLFGCLLAAGLACIARPFGVVPTTELWNRWSAHQSYLAVAAAVEQVIEPEAFVICQAQPILSVYVARERLPIGNVAFTDVLRQVPVDRPCYLAVDFFWLHSQPGRDALAAIGEAEPLLRPVAVVPNDLNIVTLGDFLTPAQIAQKVSFDTDPPPLLSAVPPPLDEFRSDVIMIYAIERRTPPENQ